MSWLDPVFIWLSRVGYAGLVWIVLALVLALATRRSPPLLALVTAGCVWSADLAAVALKALVGRPRPFAGIPEDHVLGSLPGSGSMPSGHAATAFAGALALSYAFRRAAPAFYALALAIAYSRVYLGVHYVSDVVAGAAVGTVVAAAVLLSVRRPLRLAESLRPRRSALRRG